MFYSSSSVSFVDTCETRPESYFLINQGQQLCRSICLSKYQVAQVNVHTSIHKKIQGSSRARCVWHTVWATDERRGGQTDKQRQIYMPPTPFIRLGASNVECVCVSCVDWRYSQLPALTAHLEPPERSLRLDHIIAVHPATCDIQSHLPHTNQRENIRVIYKTFVFCF